MREAQGESAEKECEAFGLSRAPIVLQAVFAKATSTVDGGWNLTFALPQDEVLNIASVSALRDEALLITVMSAELVQRDDGEAS